MARGSSEFVIQRKDKLYASGITAFGDSVEVVEWVENIDEAESLFGDVYSKHIASKLNGIVVAVESKYGEYDEQN